MVRGLRKRSESDIYHVIARGVGRQIIFEDDNDRDFFVATLSDQLASSYELLAWCLMSNHFHLLLHADLETVSSNMKALESIYARHFNWRHDRTGHLFQDRFKSEPINDDAYLLTVVRYIHANPETAGLCAMEKYPWSSYGEYLSGKGISSTDFVLGITGGVKEFRRYHNSGAPSTPLLTDKGYPRALSDEDAHALAQEIVGEDVLRRMASLQKEDRDEAIRALLGRGFSIRQVERLTGIGRGIVQRASAKR